MMKAAEKRLFFVANGKLLTSKIYVRKTFQYKKKKFGSYKLIFVKF